MKGKLIRECAIFLQRLLGEETKCDIVKISRSDGYRPLKLSSECDCIIEEDGKCSRHDHSRESWAGATAPLVVDVLTVYSRSVQVR
jgi:hypothetical protein